MHFKDLQSLVKGSVGITQQTLFYKHTLTESVDGTVYIDGTETSFSTLEEAKEHIQTQRITEGIQSEIYSELYEEMSDNKIADIIKTHYDDIRITDTLIESYVELASSKLFTTDPVVHDIRHLNKLDQLVEGYSHFVLNDGSTVAISEDTHKRINKVLGQHNDVVDYMRESHSNFMEVLNLLEE